MLTLDNNILGSNQVFVQEHVGTKHCGSPECHASVRLEIEPEAMGKCVLVVHLVEVVAIVLFNGIAAICIATGEDLAYEAEARGRTRRHCKDPIPLTESCVEVSQSSERENKTNTNLPRPLFKA